MPSVTYEGRRHVLEGDETLLDCLLRNDISVPYGCRAGVCQSCLMQAVAGVPPHESQSGLKDTQKLDKQFLPCICHPGSDLEVVLPGTVAKTYRCPVIDVERLSAEIARVRLGRPKGFEYRAGQSISLVGPGGATRSYSLASVPELDDYLELHVRRVPSGLVSNWIHDELKSNARIDISEAMGQCFYVPNRPQQPLLLIGTGSGLAPLYGILRDALRHGHSGPIHLYQGSSYAGGLYYLDEIRALAAQHTHLRYTPSLSQPHEIPDVESGRAYDIALQSLPDLSDWRIYLCGHPDMVSRAKKNTYLAGASLKDIFTDSFTFIRHPAKAA